jgi:hypothetical protein
MEKISIVTSKPNRAGKTVIINKIGIKFDDHLKSEVDSEILEDILKSDKSISVAEPNKAGSEKKPESGSGDTKEDYKKDLNKMTKADLVELAKGSNLIESEYNGLNKIQLVDYLISKLEK